MRETAIRMAFTLSASALAALIAAPVVVAQDEAAGAAAAVAIVGSVVLLYVIIALAALLALGVWIWALVDCIQREFPGQNDKLVWMLVLIISWLLGLNVVAAIVYLIAGRPKGWKPGEQLPPSPGPPIDPR